MRFQAVAGAIFAGLAVMLGAFGAHVLRDSIPADRLEIFKTGAEYQLIHGLALLVLAALHGKVDSKWSGWLWVAGIVVFSGSLYALSMSGLRWFGAITPVGGVCFITGWAVLAVRAARLRVQESQTG